jgi:glycosyltransferase involved in cell wall biosynthesis
LGGDLKHGALLSARLLALPSRHENLGVAVIEAMAHGVPVLVTPGVASHVYVDQAGAGLTVADNVEAISSGIRRLLADDQRSLGDRGRRFVEQNLAWPVVLRQLETLYRDAVGPSGACPDRERGQDVPAWGG